MEKNIGLFKTLWWPSLDSYGKLIGGLQGITVASCKNWPSCLAGWCPPSLAGWLALNLSESLASASVEAGEVFREREILQPLSNPEGF